MNLAIILCIVVACCAVLPETDAQATYMVPSSCKINVTGCPSNRSDNKCNRCCRSAGCDRGDCNAYNCRCKGCPRG